MVWLYKHTMIAKPDDVYVDFEPYFKKWGGEVILLRPTLADLRPSEVFTNDIPLKKRMSLLNEMEAESSKEDNENSDAVDDHSDSSGNSDSRVKVIGAEKSEESGEKEKDDANEAVNEKKSSDDVGINVPEAVGEQTEILNDEEKRQSSKDAIENADVVIVKEDDPKPSVNDDTDTVNAISEANNAAIVQDEDPILRLNNNSEQLDGKNIDNNVRQVEVIVEEQTILKDTDVHDDEAKVTQEIELVTTDAAMVHTDAVTGKDKADMDKPKEKVRINFTPPSFSLQLYVAEKGKAQAGQSNSEAVKVDSKAVDVSSLGLDVSYQAGHVTYEGNKEPIKLPSYVVKGEGSTDYPTMKKVKEELYEAWELKIKDNDNKLGNAFPSTSNRVDLTTEDDCNPADKDPKESTVARPYGKGKKKKLIIPKALRK
ncbi:hypothetical protein ZOSMA_515G00030 [Zostera marina]|uniref:Uncharacterized protein n=1 Tax=Zostera marina TaxID=29655 RepID=A0A0K9P039_ZOSMR|nr:hypothetical protein ZOSMA_515G00030 [Zostera marina]